RNREHTDLLSGRLARAKFGGGLFMDELDAPDGSIGIREAGEKHFADIEIPQPFSQERARLFLDDPMQVAEHVDRAHANAEESLVGLFDILLQALVEGSQFIGTNR